jgi:hypothetical protein
VQDIIVPLLSLSFGLVLGFLVIFEILFCVGLDVGNGE